MIKSGATIAGKDKIRKETLGKLRSQGSFDRTKKSAEIKTKLFKMSAFKSSRCVMLYVSKGYEVDTHEMIKEALNLKKRIIVPVTCVGEKRIIPSEIKNFEKELETGPFGIQQPKKEYTRPVPTDAIDLVITPGIAFDKGGHRIGHGKGYYDSFLKTLPPSTLTIGLAFDFQVVRRIPTLSHDAPVKKIISA